MFKNYLLITYRSLIKKKLFVLINVFGMGIAIACCIVAYVNLDYFSKWDKSFGNTENIYRVQVIREFQNSIERYGASPMPLRSFVKQSMKGISQTSRYHSTYSDIRIGDEVFGIQMAFADSSFFDLFEYELKYGVFQNFGDPSKIFISDEVALKYFKKEDVVGEPFTQIILGKDGVRRPKEFIIGGVFKKKPWNSSFNFQIITLFENFWDVNMNPDLGEMSWKGFTGALFFQVDNPSDVSSITSQLVQFVEPQNKVREDFKISAYYLQPFGSMMKQNRKFPRVFDNFLGSVPAEAFTVPAIMAFLILLLACFNFTNTSIAISSNRLKEIGVRKVMGGQRYQLVFQFLSENIMLCFFSLLVGLAMADWLVPAYDSLWPWLELKLNYTENAGFIMFLVGLLVVTAIIAGSYPAFYITSYEPVSILKGTAKFGGTNWFTRILLGGQLAISLLTIIMAVAFYNNGKYQQEYDLGFAKSGVISTSISDEGSFNTYRDALAENKNIKIISGTKNHIATSYYIGPVKYESEMREVDIMDIGDNYFDVMDMSLLAGRHFESNSETDRKESIIVTEEFVKTFGWKEDPIGKRIVLSDSIQLYVIGVVKNVYNQALFAPIKPMMIRYVFPTEYEQLIVSTDSENISEVNAFMDKKWKEVFPNSQYNGRLMDAVLQESNNINKNVVTMFGFLGFFAVLMTGIGLYTLVSLNIIKKMKQIGIRKVLGASISNIVWTINLEFIISFIISLAIGGTMGYMGANSLMDSVWEYYLRLNLLGLSICIITMILVVFIVVGKKAFSAAALNPTDVLRNE
jgi:ABC-type antimicrobial peptide transport system permease subunit